MIGPAEANNSASERKQNIKVHVLGINYNYARFISSNLSNWREIIDRSDGLLFVDDQSSLHDAAYQEVKSAFAGHWATTQHSKSRHNAINQMRAIKHGLEQIGINDNAYYWIVDCDDAPIAGAADKIRNDIASHPGYELIGYARQEGSSTGETRHPRRSHPLWLSNAPTSSLVVRGSALKAIHNRLFHERSFVDVWYDIRLSALIQPERTRISPIVTHIKTSHDANDSLRYRRKKLKVLRRIIASIIYRYTVGLRRI